MRDRERPNRFKPRYRLSANVKVAILVEADGYPSQPVDARLVDISRDGVKLAVSEFLALNENAQLKFCFREAGFDFRVDGSICWENQINENTWNVGCSLSPTLPAQFFATLTEGRPVERICDPRLPSNLHTTARWNLAELERPVVIHNYSNGGFCVWIDASGKPGERLHLSIAQVDSTLMVVGKVHWEYNADNGCLIGCSFLNSRDYERLQRLT